MLLLVIPFPLYKFPGSFQFSQLNKPSFPVSNVDYRGPEFPKGLSAFRSAASQSEHILLLLESIFSAFLHEDFPCTGNPGFNSKDNRQVIFFSIRGIAGSSAAMALNCSFSKIQFMSLKGDILWLGFQMFEGHCKVISRDRYSLLVVRGLHHVTTPFLACIPRLPPCVGFCTSAF